MKMPPSTALILAGHGSHISPQTARVVWRQVDALRALRVADEVTAAFWKEQPSFATVLDSLAADDVTVIPLFTAQGFFTRRIIPAEMRLTGAQTRRDGRLIRYTRTLGEHPALPGILQQHIRHTLERFSLDPAQTAAVLIGHGTRRNPESRAATEGHAEAVRAAGIVAEVAAVYLDDVPDIPAAYRLTRAPHLIAVPNFLALGSHVTIDVPGALGLEIGQTRGVVHGRQVYYTPPIGAGEESGTDGDAPLLHMILDLAREAGTPLHTGDSGSAWDGFPQVGRDALWQMVQQHGELRFGQLDLTRQAVRVSDDMSPLRQTFDHPAALRDFVRETPVFRPLASSRDLPGGWQMDVSGAESLHAMVETVYPGAVAAWARAQRGETTITTPEAFIARQIGMFQDLTPQQLMAAADSVCRVCVLHPVWLEADNAPFTPEARIPCNEPCNWCASAALHRAESQTEDAP